MSVTGSPVPPRATGRTTRVLWSALLRASEEDRAIVYVIARTPQMADWIWTRINDLCAPLSGLDRRRPVLTLPNGSRIIVVSDDAYRSRWGIGSGPHHVFRDHP